MKRFFYLILILCFTACFLGGCSSVEAWSSEDFSFYDTTSKEVQFPTDSSISLREETEERDERLYTKRGVEIGDRATNALAKYDLDGFWYTLSAWYGDGSSSEEKADKLDEDFHERYPTFEEALPHFSELNSTGLAVFASMQFYLEGDKLIPYTLDDKGNPIEDGRWKNTNYHVIFIIEDEKIKDVDFEIVYPAFNYTEE